MAVQTLFQKVLSRLQILNLHLRYLRSTLRDHAELMQPQMGKLHQTHRKLRLIQDNLQAIEEIVMLRFGQGRNPSVYWSYLILVELIEQMQRLTCSLLHLTEEFFIDPIGVKACLENEVDAYLIQLQVRFTQQTQLELSEERIQKTSVA